jgi:hypothetical protein
MTPPAATAAGRALPRGRVGPIPRAPRRVSGPAARPRRGADGRAGRARSAAPANDPFILRALHRTRALADSRFLDRLIRGRLWIPLVAAGLMGIVFMQVSMLKLNAGIGRAVQSAATLEGQNTNLRAAVSGMESGTRIDAAARHLGMVVPADGSAHYVSAAAAGGLAATAARRMTAADPEAIARSRVATALATGQTNAAALTTAGTAGAAATTTSAATAAPTQAAAPTGTVATAPPTTTTATTTTGAATGAAATTTPAPAATTAPTGATAAPTTQTQPTAGPSTAATSSGGAVAPPQG